ncbi:aromatic-ring-hydroxylating dioxygenase subunit beta [Amorphus sp. 3PC139-8]|uniref:aromatic-ring-hydroxylating dioxygenase subunit beta n=1 Tax=Amorphus sp. 3PC139-8 TaxID=2735676 RepID=UPI00345D874C
MGAVSEELYRDVSQFIYREARLQDTHAYDDWEALWDDEAIYWVPANGANPDPEREMSFIYDNRSRIALRIKQLKTGKRYTQTPPSQLARVVSNIELLDQEGDDVRVATNAMVYEYCGRGETVWATRNEYELRRVADGFKMKKKKVVLANNDKPIFTLSFLI